MIKFRFKELLQSANKNSKRKITINQVSKSTGIARTSLNGLYNGHSKGVTFETLDRLIEFFDVPLDRLISYISNSVQSMDIYHFKDTSMFKTMKSVVNETSTNWFNQTSFASMTYENKNTNLTYSVQIDNDQNISTPVISVLWESNKYNLFFDVDDKDYKTLIAMLILQNVDLKGITDNQECLIMLYDYEKNNELQTTKMTKKDLVNHGNKQTAKVHYRNSDNYIQVNRHY